MARRMFSTKIVGSDAFLEMPTPSRELYFQFGMYADDDGFISPRKIMRMIGASDIDLQMLIVKKFVLPFDNGVIVLKHHQMNNQIRLDRYNETEYIREKKLLYIRENKSYSFNPEDAKPLCLTQWQPNGNQMVTQYSIGKDSIEKGEKNTTPSKNGIEILKNPSEDLVKEMTSIYACNSSQVKQKADAILNYCSSKKKTYKDYKATLRSWLNKDFGLKRIDPLLQ